MGLNSEQQNFLTQDDQEAHNFNQFQTQSGESFNFREGYDAVVYKVHKKYNLRGRMIDVPETSKQKGTKQATKTKAKNPLVQTFPKASHNPNHPIVEDISDHQQPSTSIALKGTVEEPPEMYLETDSAHNNTLEKENNTKNTVGKENFVARNEKNSNRKTIQP